MSKHGRRQVKAWAADLRRLGFRAYHARRLARYYAGGGSEPEPPVGNPGEGNP